MHVYVAKGGSVIVGSTHIYLHMSMRPFGLLTVHLGSTSRERSDTILTPLGMEFERMIETFLLPRGVELEHTIETCLHPAGWNFSTG